MHSENSSFGTASQIRMQTCMNALEKLSRVWVEAKIAYARFEKILCDKGFRRNSHGTLELAKRRYSAENPTNGSVPSHHGSIPADFGSDQTMPSQFRDRLPQMIPDRTTGLLTQSDSPSSTWPSSAFQTMNLLSVAGSTSYNTTNPSLTNAYPVSMSPDMSLDSSIDPQMSLSESHQQAKQYNYHPLFPQGNLVAIYHPEL